jgi:hypothetical protein
MSDVVKALGELEALEPGWDGYRALFPSKLCRPLVLSIIEKAPSAWGEAHLLPLSDGGIGVRWLGEEIECDVEPCGQKHSLYLEDGSAALLALSHAEALCDELANANAHYETAQANWDITLDRAEALEAQLVIAREALKWIASCQSHADGDVVSLARNALAQLGER